MPYVPYWGVVNGSPGSYQKEQHTARVNRISVETLELLLEKQYQHDFNEMSEDKEEMSREDAKFMEIMEKSVSFKDGHYSVELPFKNKDVVGIKRKFERSFNNSSFNKKIQTLSTI